MTEEQGRGIEEVRRQGALATREPQNLDEGEQPLHLLLRVEAHGSVHLAIQVDGE